MNEERVVAFIDIGTNSARLLVASIDENGAYHLRTKTKERTRLGEGEYAAGRIQYRAIKRLMRILKQFMEICRNLGASEVRAVATSAMRDAGNAQEIMDCISAECDLTIRIISGMEEARLIHRGVSTDINLGNDQALFIDIGGGSTELIVGDQYTYAILESMQLGAIRVTNQFLAPRYTRAVSQKWQVKMMTHIMEVASPSITRVSAYSFTRSIGSSGTVTNLAEVCTRLYHAEETRGLPDGSWKRQVLLLADLEKLYPYMCSLTLKKRRKILGLNRDRAEIILAGSAILLVVMRTLKILEIEINDRDLLYGMLMDYLAEMPGTPQFEQMPVKWEDILQLGRYWHLEEKHARDISRMSLALFDSAKECGLHNYGTWE
ncbi:MAG: Ppx/GppA family phosphatase [Methanocalculaceae archaeon]|jgi:exopolyphosphatase/guanosine-5'-triphosphate,3'-diphosphate pyrophosphatase|nr:Ppx/GppA family phosphatase [Methanocalculaceae archaeon]